MIMDFALRLTLDECRWLAETIGGIRWQNREVAESIRLKAEWAIAS